MPRTQVTSGARVLPTTSSASQATVRAHNLSLVLGQILDHPGQLSRARIAEAIGITRATASDLVDRLVAAQIVVEVTDTQRSGAGRPGKLLAPAPRRHVGLGLEIQADRLTVGAIDLTGTILANATVLGDHSGVSPRTVIRRLSGALAQIVRDLDREGVTIVGACASVPGILQSGSGTVKLAPNLGWSDVELLDLLRADPLIGRYDVHLANDADLGALWEASTLAHTGAGGLADQSLLFLEGAVGIGGAIILGGALAAGAHGWSGEIGHQMIDPNGRECACGGRGCLETFAGRNAMLEAAGLESTDSIEDLVLALESGDPRAQQAVDDAADALGVAVSSAINLIDVDRVVLSGTLAALHGYLHERISAHILARVIIARWVPVRVDSSLSGTDSSLRGGAMRGLQTLVRDPVRYVD